MKEKQPNGDEYPLVTGREWYVGTPEELESSADISSVDKPYPGNPYKLAGVLGLVIPGPQPPETLEQ